MHFVQLLWQLPEQAGSTPAAGDGDTQKLLHHSQPDCHPGDPSRVNPATHHSIPSDGIHPAYPGISTIHNDDGHGRNR